VTASVLLESHLPGVPLVGRGKVRDIYDLGDSLLFVATDRISAFDCILGSGIPGKGRVLTQMTLFWLDFLSGITPNHLLSTDVARFGAEFEGRSMIVKKAHMIDVECVARGYLAGSGWKEYRQQQSVCGIPLPAGLEDGSRLPEPIFTPATKAQSGHDENVSFEAVAGRVGRELAEELKSRTLAIYRVASEYALSRGIILADTKFEFGFVNGELLLADEVLTPDSSRFWPRDTWKPGGAQVSYDKQFVRDYLESIPWNKQYPAPLLPDDVVNRTAEKYHEAYRLLTGRSL
jgi:phosphoribosylaminoimidazole-succinocarboxamide synthase